MDRLFPCNCDYVRVSVEQIRLRRFPYLYDRCCPATWGWGYRLFRCLLIWVDWGFHAWLEINERKCTGFEGRVSAGVFRRSQDVRLPIRLCFEVVPCGDGLPYRLLEDIVLCVDPRPTSVLGDSVSVGGERVFGFHLLKVTHRAQTDHRATFADRELSSRDSARHAFGSAVECFEVLEPIRIERVCRGVVDLIVVPRAVGGNKGH